MKVLSFNIYWISIILIAACALTWYHNLILGVIVTSISFAYAIYLGVATTVAKSKYKEMQNEKNNE